MWFRASGLKPFLSTSNESKLKRSHHSVLIECRDGSPSVADGVLIICSWDAARVLNEVHRASKTSEQA